MPLHKSLTPKPRSVFTKSSAHSIMTLRTETMDNCSIATATNPCHNGLFYDDIDSTTQLSTSPNSCNSCNCYNNDTARASKLTLDLALTHLQQQCKSEIEQSWKEVESLKRQCSEKMKKIIRLRLQIDASKARNCVAMGKIARLNLKTRRKYPPQELQELQKQQVELERNDLSPSPKSNKKYEKYTLGLYSHIHSKKEQLLKFSSRCRIKKGSHTNIIQRRKAEKLLKLRSRDMTILALRDAVQDSIITVSKLREQRWFKVRQRLGLVDYMIQEC
jgi:hypothetical protein